LNSKQIAFSSALALRLCLRKASETGPRLCGEKFNGSPNSNTNPGFAGNDFQGEKGRGQELFL